MLRARCRARRRCLILGRAFRLHLFGDETALRHQPAFDERLRAILESIGKGIAANIADRQVLALLFEDKIDAAVRMRNRPGTDIAGNPHALMQRCGRQRGKLGDRVVVGLALRESNVSQH